MAVFMKGLALNKKKTWLLHKNMQISCVLSCALSFTKPESDILGTQSPKHLQLKRISNQFPLQYTVVKYHYVNIIFWFHFPHHFSTNTSGTIPNPNIQWLVIHIFQILDVSGIQITSVYAPRFSIHIETQKSFCFQINFFQQVTFSMPPIQEFYSNDTEELFRKTKS